MDVVATAGPTTLDHALIVRSCEHAVILFMILSQHAFATVLYCNDGEDGNFFLPTNEKRPKPPVAVDHPVYK